MKKKETVETAKENDKGKEREKAIIKRIIQVFFFLILEIIIFFVAAGRWDILRGWFTFGLSFAYLMFNLIVFYKYTQELIAERSNMQFTKSWDIIFAIGYTLMILVLAAVAGLDVGRFQLSNLGVEYTVLGTTLFIAGAAFISWAMVENKFFETAVRVQKEKKQTVVSTGPYAIIRHPGYAGMILMYFALPLLFGSLYALIPSAIIFILFVIRTKLEDETLRKELKGYNAYTNKVRYRLIPGVW